MKEKVISLINDNKGGISLFVLVLASVVLAYAIASLCTDDRLTRLFLSLSFGVLGDMGIGLLGDKVGMKLSDSHNPSILAIIIGGFLLI